MPDPNDLALFDRGKQTIDSVVELALSCPAGGDARWDALLAKLGARALAPEQRAQHLREGPGQGRGALLLELRWALDAVVTPLTEHMERPYDLTNAVDQAVRDYVGATRPKVTTASIFANALASASTSPSRSVGSAGASADVCRCCGAPRQGRAEDRCRYCGEAR